MMIEERFFQLIKDIDISRPRVDLYEYQNFIAWLDSEHNFVFLYDFKFGFFWINYRYILFVLEEFQMNFTRIEAFIKKQLEHYFRLADVAIVIVRRSPLRGLEQHFKLKSQQ